MCWKMEGGSVLERANCRAKGGAPGFKVAIQGAAGGIGQQLAMLMKMNPLVSVLHLYDVVNDAGVTAHISHMDTGDFNEEDGKVCQGRHEGGNKQNQKFMEQSMMFC
ncbi:putative malate dehydrogenase [Helianthus anomalus]